jgi:hypothetical protein
MFSWVDFSGYFIPPQEYSPHRSIGRRGRYWRRRVVAAVVGRENAGHQDSSICFHGFIPIGFC